MPFKQKTWLAATMLPILFFAFQLSTPVSTAWFGEEILLKTRPVDPSDLLYGDYVTLEYEIEEVSVKRTPAWDKLYSSYDYDGKLVYLVLTDERPNRVKQVSLREPADGLYIKAQLDAINSSRWNQNTSMFQELKETYLLQLSIPSNRFYVRDNTGLALEEAARTGDVLVKARVWRGFPLMQEIGKK